MDVKTPYLVNRKIPLKPIEQRAIIEEMFKGYLDTRYRALKMELNDVMRLLGRNPKRCPHCGGELE
jgi:hypothetical protein